MNSDVKLESDPVTLSPAPEVAEQVAPRIHPETLGMLLGALGVLTFSFSLPMTRLAVGGPNGLDPWFIAMGRAVVAGALAIVALLILRAPRPTSAQFRRLIWVAAGVVIGFPLFSTLALRYVPASRGSIVNGLLPLATAIIGSLITHERPSRRFWWAAAAGSAAVVIFAAVTGGGAPQPADGLMLLAVIAGAVGYAEGGRLSRELGGPQTICWALILSLPVVVPIALWAAPHDPLQVPSGAWGGFAYVSVFSMFLGFFVWYRGLALGGIARVSQVQLLQPILSLSVAALLLGESISIWMIVTALVVLASIVVGRRAPVRRIQPKSI